MAYADLDHGTREIAERVLTKKQLDVFKLWMSGLSPSGIALTVGVSEPVARRALTRAQQLIAMERERKEVDEPSAA
jgi:DNA-binding CsgD family transcriptional regulator